MCPQGQGTPRTPPTNGRTFGVEFSMTHKSAGRLWPISRPPAHVQLLIGAACSISAPGLNEVTHPSCLGRAQLEGSGARRPSPCLGRLGNVGQASLG